MADCRRLPLDCRQIAVRLLSWGWSLIAKSVEIGRRIQGVTGVSYNKWPY
jgi:hypothetical protein